MKPRGGNGHVTWPAACAGIVEFPSDIPRWIIPAPPKVLCVSEAIWLIYVVLQFSEGNLGFFVLQPWVFFDLSPFPNDEICHPKSSKILARLI